MSTPLVVLVTGLPATGKSRLAAEIARRLRCPLVAKDAIKEPLLEVLGVRDRAWSRRLSDAAFAVLFALAHALLATGRPFVLEGNFRPGEHETKLGELATSVRLVQILCTAPAAARAARLQARALDPCRHAGHADAALLGAAPARADFLDLPGERLVHDSTTQDAGPLLLERLFGSV